jgi:hypothetical protein
MRIADVSTLLAEALALGAGTAVGETTHREVP